MAIDEMLSIACNSTTLLLIIAVANGKYLAGLVKIFLIYNILVQILEK